MKCPFCHAHESFVKDSRDSDDGQIIRRRRECSKCHSRFTTYEKVHNRELIVVKKSGAKKIFDRDKVRTSISTALRKRNIEDSRIDELVSTICSKLESDYAKEVKSGEIGDLIMSELSGVDEVAYIRFASVYKDFASAKDFTTFITSSIEKKRKLKRKT